MLNLHSLMLGSQDPQALADFYSEVLQKEADWAEDGWFGFTAGSSVITIGFHDKVKAQAVEPARIILNFETKAVKKEFERIKAIGAHIIAEPYTMEGMPDGWIATFADPDGNYFQLTTPWENT